MYEESIALSTTSWRFYYSQNLDHSYYLRRLLSLYFNQHVIQLHRNFGKLHTAQNKLDEALDDLSKDIYCSSLEVGPEHIDTSAGYFLIANIFYAQRKVMRWTRSKENLLHAITFPLL